MPLGKQSGWAIVNAGRAACRAKIRRGVLQVVLIGFCKYLELDASAAGLGTSLRYSSTASTTCCTTSYIPWKKPMACWQCLRATPAASRDRPG